MGIQVLYPAGEEADDIDIGLNLNLDIVAIHGLNGNPINTWTEPKSQKLWFRDFLPKDVPNARIMTFGYDATAAFERSTAGILEHARDLLRCLDEARLEFEEINRPILFIVHSLGGLVLKQALVIAAESGIRQYKPIWEATKGVLFFGTPHRGSSLAKYGAQLARVPTALSMKPTPRLLEALKAGSLVLSELNDSFSRLMHSKGQNEGKSIVSFYETKPMFGGAVLVVEQTSALINSLDSGTRWETPIPVSATHRDMCRFSSSRDSTYITAVKSIKRLRNGNRSEKTVANEYFQVPTILNPHFTGRQIIRSKMRENLMVEQASLEKRQKRFVLFGIGGSGKTQVSLKFWAVLFIDASSYSTAAKGFQSIAHTFKLPLSTLPAHNIEKVGDFLSTKTDWLLIIDNADDPHLDISHFFPPGDNGTIVITTRYPGFVQHSTAGSTSVEEMSSTDAVALLERVAGLETQSTDVEGETDGSRITTIEGVVKALGYLALAIIQAGAVIRQKLVPLEGFCSLFSKRKKDLLDLGVPNIDTESQRTVFTTWEISIGMIEAVKEPHAQFALELLNLFAFMHFDGITMIIFERAVQNASEAGASRGTSFRGSSMMRFMPNGWDVILAAKALKVLASYSLVTVDDSYSISIHPLIHQWTRDRLGETQRLEAWKASLLTVAVATHWFWSINILPTRKSMLPHIDSCISYGEDKLFLGGPDVEDRIFAALTFARAYQEDFRGNAIDLSIKALECVQIHKPSGCFYHLSAVDQVARDLATLGRFKQSAEILEEALELKETQESRDIMNKSLLLLLFGEVLSSSGQALKSLEICQNLRKTYLSDLGEGDPTMIQALETIGYAKRQLGKQKDAIMCLQSCLKLRERYHGSNHYLTGFENFRQLAELYYQTRQVKKAVMTQTEYINRLKGSFGGENLQTKLAVSVLGVYKTRNSFLRGKGIMEGIPIAKEALSRETYGETTVPELICMEQLVTYYSVAGAFDKALDLQTEILELCVQKLGESNSVTIQAQKKKQQLQKLLAIRRAIFWWVPRKIYERDWAKV